MHLAARELFALLSGKDGVLLEKCLQNIKTGAECDEYHKCKDNTAFSGKTTAELIRQVDLLQRIKEEPFYGGKVLTGEDKTNRENCWTRLIPHWEKKVVRELVLRLELLDSISKRKEKEVRLVTDVTNSIASSLDMKKLFKVIATKIKCLVDFDRASIVLIDQGKTVVTAFVLVTDSESHYREGIYPLSGTAQEWVLQHRRTCTEDNLKSRLFRENQGLYAEGLRSSIRVPLILREKVIGTLNFDSKRVSAYSTAEQNLLEQMAGQIAIAIDNSRLFDQVKQQVEKIALINSSLEKIVYEKTAKVRELEKKRKIMTGLIAHSLKNPILGLRQTLRMLSCETETQVPQTFKTTLEELSFSCDLLLGIVNDMLDVCRSEFDRIPVQLSDTSVSRLLTEAARLLSYQIMEKEVAINWDNHYKDIELQGDEKRLIRVFVNLLENAVRFSRQRGNIQINLKLQKGDYVPPGVSRGPWAMIDIADEGPGIPETDLTRIFEEFYQVERGNLQFGTGSGLGLCYCKKIVEAHKGLIWAENRAEGGTVFHVMLPIYSPKEVCGQTTGGGKQITR